MVKNENPMLNSSQKKKKKTKKNETSTSSTTKTTIRNDNNNNNNNNNNKNDIKLNDEEMAIRDTIVPSLMIRAYHLPGYNYKQDLYQYLTNNHPVFGICLHHKYHPVGFYVRILSFIGSALFGLAITNIIYIAFVFTNINYNTSYIEVPTTNITNGILIASSIEQSAPSALSITNGNIALWTIGATIHALYDNIIWNLAACTCFMKKNMSIIERQKRYQSTGTFLVLLSVVIVVALTTLAVTIRQSFDNNNNNNNTDTTTDTITDNNNNNTEINTTGIYELTKNNIKLYNISNSSNPNQIILVKEINNDTTTQDYEFLIAYAIELALNYFIYYPIVGTILFSGILVCGKYEMCGLGGRPYEVKYNEEKLYEEQQERKNNIELSKKKLGTLG